MSTFRPASKRAFTLIELLVAMAVVVLLMTGVIAILTSATALSGQSRKHIDADNEARMVFDRMGADFSRMLKRADVDYIFSKTAGGSSTMGANDTCFFFSEAPSLAGTTTSSLQNSVALIGYNISSGYQLQRLGQGLVLGAAPAPGMIFLTYSPVTATPPPLPGTAGFAAPLASSTLGGTSAGESPYNVYVGNSTDVPPYSSGTSSDYHVLGPDVFRLEFCFLLKPQTASDGTVLPAVYSNQPYDSRSSPGPAHVSTYGIGLNDVQAVVVAIAILDGNSRKILSPANLATLTAALTDSDYSSSGAAGNLAKAPPVLMAQTWDGEINPSNFSAPLKAVVPATRIYQRTFYLSPFLTNP